MAIASRRLHQETCAHWRYGFARRGEEVVQVAQYAAKDGPHIVAQKWRSRAKDFGWVGNPKGAESLYGRHLCRDGGRKVIVTEGELDALSMSQVLDLRWPVVSLSNGAGSAKRAFADNLEWLETFDEVVIMFDQDEEGAKNAQAAAAVLSPGRAKIARLPLKDASEMLVAGREKELVDASWSARPWRPDGILEGAALWERATFEADTPVIPYPWPGLNEKLRGLRRKELVTIAAGTGIGKSSFCRELAVHLIRSGEKVGIVALEENAKQTLTGMLGILTKRNYRTETVDWAALEPVWRTELADRLALLDHFGTTDSDELASRIRYLVKGLGCTFVVLDHITLAVSGDEGDSDRRAIDRTMASMRKLVEETGAGMLLVSQLKRRQGPGYETGTDPHLSDLRGSSAIEQLSDVVIALSRNQASDEADVRVFVRKNRPIGVTGLACTLEWDQETGTYREMSPFDEVPS